MPHEIAPAADLPTFTEMFRRFCVTMERNGGPATLERKAAWHKIFMAGCAFTFEALTVQLPTVDNDVAEDYLSALQLEMNRLADQARARIRLQHNAPRRPM